MFWEIGITKLPDNRQILQRLKNFQILRKPVATFCVKQSVVFVQPGWQAL